MSLVAHAKRELELAGLMAPDSDYDGLIGRSALALIEVFAQQGHSGGSAAITIEVVERLMRFEPLTPIGNPKETGDYHDVSEYSGVPAGTMLQSTRDSRVFSDDGGETWYRLVDSGREPLATA